MVHILYINSIESYLFRYPYFPKVCTTFFMYTTFIPFYFGYTTILKFFWLFSWILNGDWIISLSSNINLRLNVQEKKIKECSKCFWKVEYSDSFQCFWLYIRYRLNLLTTRRHKCNWQWDLIISFLLNSLKA